MLTRRTLLLGLSAAAAASLTSRAADATVAEALNLSDLVHQSRHRVLATPVDKSSLWEVVGGRRRIVTYTVLRVDGALDGGSVGSGDVAVRTLGGHVGDIGQLVHGEAALVLGQTSSVFLHDLGRDVYTVTGMAQGHFPTRADDGGSMRLYMSPEVGPLIRSQEAAVLRLHGQKLVDAQRLILEELEHAR